MDSHFANLPSITGSISLGTMFIDYFLGLIVGPTSFCCAILNGCPIQLILLHLCRDIFVHRIYQGQKFVALLASHARLTCFSQIDSWHEEASVGAHKVKMPFMPEVNPAFHIVVTTDHLQLNVVLFISIFCYHIFNQAAQLHEVIMILYIYPVKYLFCTP